MSSNPSTEQQNQRALLKSNAFFNKKFIITLVMIIMVVTTVVLLFMNTTGKKLVIEDLHNGDILWQEEVHRGDWFSHRYIHSVERSPVEEKFKIDEDWVILTMESWTKSFGAGLPYEYKGDVKMEDGYFIIQNLNRPVFGGELKMQPSHLYPHAFHFKDQEVTLSEPPYSDTQILIEVQDMNIWDRIKLLF
ncbi:DUF1850 domain-containing protein [Tenuibacillus multivorans]|uniref:DUF1850 domain-containing protein n=1 Tax=Tenuibacillus multivorans TaxID=237069 RepID=A0A1H0AUZ7_9BACI|nr:DUF1850 domain-containing protein [Tenuibacillus multivorans]GEL77808.1 hypothetical protein TMU01_20430 [Tenuibacillus multivorans]SDN37219.1 protein of unknown function [Tenuibacillus multivorans]